MLGPSKHKWIPLVDLLVFAKDVGEEMWSDTRSRRRRRDVERYALRHLLPNLLDAGGMCHGYNTQADTASYRMFHPTW